MAARLYKTGMSPPARAAMMGCEVFGLKVQLIDVNLAEKEQFKPDYLNKNPLHTIPLLEDGDIIIHDSHTILMYLADVYGKDDTWYPKDAKQRALVNQKLFFDTGVLFPRLRNAVFPVLRQGAKQINEKQYDDIDEAYQFMESFLSRSTYLAMDHVTIADISAYSTMTSLIQLLHLDAKRYPKTIAWIDKINEYPFVQNCNAPGAALFGKIINDLLKS